MKSIDEIYYDAVDLLKQMINTPSVSRSEQDVADVVEKFITARNIQCERVDNNIICRSLHFDVARKTLLLNSHIDTVKPVDGWVREPYKAECEDDVLYGLGSNDAGASLVSLLAAFIYLYDKELSYNIVFVASCEEEVSGKGGIESVLPLLGNISCALVGEPTAMRPAVAEKGLLVLDCNVYGRSGHAARNEGDNAIYKALPIIEGLRNFKFDKESPYLGAIKLSVTQISAGTQHNVVPDKCSFVVDVRTTDAYSNEETLAIIKSAFPCEIKERSTRLNSSNIPETHPLVRRLMMMGCEPFGSPTLSDQALMPFPSLKCGPGESSRSHTADEYIKLSEIRDAIEKYVKLLDGMEL